MSSQCAAVTCSCGRSPVTLTRHISSRSAQPIPLSPGSWSRTYPGGQQRARFTCMAVQPFTDVALILPSFVPVLARALTGGVLIYTVLNWAHYQRIRKQTEKYLEENEEAAKEQKKKLDRLSGKSVEENERD